ncbi:MAG TPA: metallophosphoesterase [Armatimonadota bacterium]|jgi:hypothetical protein
MNARPSTDSAPALTFVALGDLHIGANDRARLETAFRGAARHKDAAFLAAPGDLTNAGLPEQYAELRAYAERLPMPLVAIMGNHEYHTGPDDDARKRFCMALGLKAPSYIRTAGPVTMAFLSTDRDIDGCSVDIRDSLPILESALERAKGPVIAFCHAPLSGTVGAAEGRNCFLSSDPFFSVGCSARVRALVRSAGKPVVWICGHTHSPLATDGLIGTEYAGDTPIHTVNLSSPYYTGRDFVQTEPIAVYRFEVSETGVEVIIEDADTGAVLRRESLPPG